MHCRRIELRVQPALESQRGKAIGLFCLTRVVALRVVCGRERARTRHEPARAPPATCFPFLRQLQLGHASLGLREVDVSLRAEPVEERP